MPLIGDRIAASVSFATASSSISGVAAEASTAGHSAGNVRSR